MSLEGVTLSLSEADLERIAERAAEIVLERLREERATSSRLLTVTEAAAATGLTPHAIRHHVRRGQLRSVKLGHRVLVPVDAIEELGG